MRELAPGDLVMIVEPVPGRTEEEQRFQANAIKRIICRYSGEIELAEPAPEWMREGCMILLQDDVARMN